MFAPELEQGQIDELLALLETQKSELELQLAQAATAAKPVTLDQQSVGRVSRIDAIQQQQMALANQQQTTRMVKRIERALQRIASDAYGYCQQCEEPITFARLQVQPFADLCLNCQSASEKS
ncbi:MAG: DnaK suppressor protein [Olavius algarvensis Gamma 3 endosymbiont]|nr:MAG: DnaK suppressor protein [Olavius algarvensis Gamma 3 endosymbiont]